MTKPFPLMLAVLGLIGFFVEPVCQAQNATEQATDEPATDEPATDEPAQKSPAQQVTDLIKQNELDRAAAALDDAIKDAPDDNKLWRLRFQLAQSYLLKRKTAPALKLLESVLERQLERIDQVDSQIAITSTVAMLRVTALRAGKVGDAKRAVDRAIDALQAVDRSPTAIQALAVLLPQKALEMATAGDLDGALELIRNRIKQIDESDADGAQETFVVAKSKFLFAAAMLPGAPKNLINEADAFIQQALIDHGDSLAVLREYGSAQMNFVRTTYRDAPAAAAQRIRDATEIFQNAPDEHQRALSIYVRSMTSLQPRIAAALKLKQLIGNPAPEFEIDAWVNQGDVTEKTLPGKVVLIDFWSVWCGPCIATFPHLRDWYDEFHEDGLEIVGVTRYYNYQWNDEAKRAIRSAKPVDHEFEQETLAKFLQHHELRHPTIITPRESTMQKEFGVTGIPHAVLVDRKGNVQMIKVGSSPNNAAALHAKIKELLAE